MALEMSPSGALVTSQCRYSRYVGAVGEGESGSDSTRVYELLGCNLSADSTFPSRSVTCTCRGRQMIARWIQTSCRGPIEAGITASKLHCKYSCHMIPAMKVQAQMRIYQDASPVWPNQPPCECYHAQQRAMRSDTPGQRGHSRPVTGSD